MSKPKAPAAPRSVRTPHQRLILRLAASIRDDRRLAFRYVDGAGAVTERVVLPVALAYAGGAWLLAGHCRLRGALRTFRTDRIDGLRVLLQPGGDGAPAQFSARDYGAHPYAAGSGPQRLATVGLGGALRPLARVLFPTALLEPGRPEEALRCHLRARNLAILEGMVAFLGPGAEVLHPHPPGSR